MKGVYDPGLPFKLSSVYGDRPHPKNPNTREFHAGVDYAAPVGTPIPAATSGVVVYSGRNSGFGNTVVVRNATGDYSLYAHMQDGDRAKVGQRVWPGDTLGQVGSTGVQAKGNHLHYSLLPASAREAIENPNLSRDGGPIGIQVNKANTIDPARYDPQPYLDDSRRAAEIFSGVDEKASRNGGIAPDRPSTPFFNPFNPAPVASFVALPAAPASDAPANFADRFGSWAAQPGLSKVGAPAPQVAPKEGKRSELPEDVIPTSVTATDDDNLPVRILGRRVANLSTAPARNDAPPFVPREPAASTANGPASPPPLLGIFSGKPMSDWPVRPSIFQTTDQASHDDELFQRWMRWVDA